MYEFEYTNGLYEQEIDLIINFITKELTSIRKNKKNSVSLNSLQNVHPIG